MCLLLEVRLSLHDFVCDRVLFSLNKEFSGIVKKLHSGVKNRLFFFWKFPFFLRIFWSDVVGAIDTFVAEHVANMFS